MTEIVKINWILMAANGCWILGAAVIAARLSIMEFTRRSGKIEKFPKKLLLLSGGLIVLGAVLINFKIPTFKLLVPKITHLDETRLPSCDRDIVFPLKDLEMDIMNGRHKRNTTGIIDNSLALFFDGFIRAPMMKFGAGDYTVSFSARGTEAMDEYAALKIEFERLENSYLIVRKMKLIPLSRSMKSYEMRFAVNEPSIGRIKISFVNDDLEPGGKRDRNAWIKEITIKKL